MSLLNYPPNYDLLKSNLFLPNNYSSLLTYTNLIQEDNNCITNESTNNTVSTEDNINNKAIDINDTLPTYRKQKNLIKIPSKVNRMLTRNHVPSEILCSIHKDKDVAKEMCLLFLSLLVSTQYVHEKDDDDSDGWKSLHTKYLQDLLSLDKMCYKAVREALCYTPKNGKPIIYCDEFKIVGKKNFHYRLEESILTSGVNSYKLKTKQAQKALNDNYINKLKVATKNVICRNLIEFNKHVTLPTESELLKRGKELVNNEHVTSKGKTLTFRNKRSDNKFKNLSKLTFVEDNIKQFKTLAGNGLRVPTVGSRRNGHRIVDSFTLLNKWIRNEVKYKGEKLAEIDYSCLHPNIAISEYDGSLEYITHKQIAKESEICVKRVKKQHLSFFNTSVFYMERSPLYPYYSKQEPEMIDRIKHDKLYNEEGSNITSRIMFGKEVSIMTDVIDILNNKGIYVMYVYDAVMCLEKDIQTVMRLMNETALKYDVKTTAKCSIESYNEPMIENTIQTNIEPKEEVKSDEPLPPKDAFIIDVKVGITNGIPIIESIIKAIDDGKDIIMKDAYIDWGDEYIFEQVIEVIEDYAIGYDEYVGKFVPISTLELVRKGAVSCYMKIPK